MLHFQNSASVKEHLTTYLIRSKRKRQLETGMQILSTLFNSRIGMTRWSATIIIWHIDISISGTTDVPEFSLNVFLWPMFFLLKKKVVLCTVSFKSGNLISMRKPLHCLIKRCIGWLDDFIHLYHLLENKTFSFLLMTQRAEP